MKQLITLKKITRETMFSNGIRLQMGQTETGQWFLNYFKDGKHILSKKCSCEADCRQRFGKYEAKYFFGADINL